MKNGLLKITIGNIDLMYATRYDIVIILNGNIAISLHTFSKYHTYVLMIILSIIL